jgi:hypothetical protein
MKRWPQQLDPCTIARASFRRTLERWEDAAGPAHEDSDTASGLRRMAGGRGVLRGRRRDAHHPRGDVPATARDATGLPDGATLAVDVQPVRRPLPEAALRRPEATLERPALLRASRLDRVHADPSEVPAVQGDAGGGGAVGRPVPARDAAPAAAPGAAGSLDADHPRGGAVRAELVDSAPGRVDGHRPLGSPATQAPAQGHRRRREVPRSSPQARREVRHHRQQPANRRADLDRLRTVRGDPQALAQHLEGQAEEAVAALRDGHARGVQETRSRATRSSSTSPSSTTRST